jgi:hypothetical protein
VSDTGSDPARSRPGLGLTGTIDQRGIPTHACLVCGSTLFQIHATFEDYDISGWLLDGTCANCASPVTVPCPVDDPLA